MFRTELFVDVRSGDSGLMPKRGAGCVAFLVGRPIGSLSGLGLPLEAVSES